MDAVVQTTTHTYLIEFKLNETAAVAMQQIHDKRYADKFRLNGKAIVGVGVNFNTSKEDKRVDDWAQEVL